MTGQAHESIEIIAHSDRVEHLLAPYKEHLGDDFCAYRGHVYRVITYAMHFLDGDRDARPIIETALVYHDLGLWTDKTLSYLEPSEALVRADNEAQGWGFDPDVLCAIIRWHHKITSYAGPHHRLVEAVRRADWIDATSGVRRMGLSRAQVRTVEHAIDSHGFATVLRRLMGNLGGSLLGGGVTLLRTVFKW